MVDACFYCHGELAVETKKVDTGGMVYGECCTNLVRAREAVVLMRMRERAAVRAEARQ